MSAKPIQAKELEVNGRPTVENAAAWVKAMGDQIRALGGYDWHQHRPEKVESMRMAQNALWCGAVLCRSMCIESEFGKYMPLNSVGYEWFHKLAKLAYGASYQADKDTWQVQIANNEAFAKQAKEYVGQVGQQWSNSDWVYDLSAIVHFAVSRFTAAK